MNERNLVNLADRSITERKLIASMGGKASGAARRALREAIEREKVRLAAEREVSIAELRELRLAVRELRVAEREQSCIRRLPQMPQMPSRIPRGYWDE